MDRFLAPTRNENQILISMFIWILRPLSGFDEGPFFSLKHVGAHSG